METKSLNCSVFFNPTNGKRHEKMPFKQEKVRRARYTRPGECSIGGKLFTITYVPEKSQNTSEKSSTYLVKNTSLGREDTSLSRSCVEIEEFIPRSGKSGSHLKMNYVIDDQVRCQTCWELKHALDYTFQKLYNVSQLKVAEKGLPKEMKKKAHSKKQCKSGENNSEFSSKPILSEVEDTGPLMEYFSRLVRSATISKMKNFSRCVEEKLSRREKELSKDPIKDSVKQLGVEENRQRMKNTMKPNDACESCDRLRQAMYITVSKLYEEAGVKTDFPTVQKLETYALLVYPNAVQYPATCRKAHEAKRKRPYDAGANRGGSNKDLPKKPQKTNGKRKSEEALEDENRKQLRSRIKRHKAAFTASKFVHISTALVVSLSTIAIIFMDWVKREQPYGFRILAAMIVLFFGCIYNLYLMLFYRTFSFKNYFIIPVCWVILSLSNGKCADPLMPNHICDTKIHFMSHVYLFIVFLEYYLASGIHAVLVLEINQFRRIPLKELLKYSVFNLPLMIIVLLYIIFQFLSELKRRVKEYFKKSHQKVRV